MFTENFVVEGDNVEYSDDYITSKFVYNRSETRIENQTVYVKPIKKEYSFRTDRKVPKLGCMLVGLGGNNGSTVVAGTIANREGISWDTKSGPKTPNYFGSITQCKY
eukprot:TRINITY_DN34952_c0_g5_i1.p1 TRINITY_DN34952_c0_g5~~TRINITY_DN34952_c0_g5_i1.p1  ORF type:complete len:107 (+),score=25.64 TRINITY_DN34952_c0_g5_i1:64-384(+)